MSSTIYALATPPGRSGVAVVRISGPDARAALEALTARTLPKPRVATLRRLIGRDDVPIDDALALWFPAPHSFTGEDVAELHLHGGPAVISRQDHHHSSTRNECRRPAEAGQRR